MVRLLRPRIQKKPQFEDEYRAPIHRLLSGQFAAAREMGANAILLGMPKDIPDDVRNEGKELAVLQLLPDQRDGSSSSKTIDSLSSSLGWFNVPVWMRTGQRYHPFLGVPVTQYINYLQAVQDRLVSLDGSGFEPSQKRFIEYRLSEKTIGRQFVEVELWLDEGNVFRIEILSHCVKNR